MLLNLSLILYFATLFYVIKMVVKLVQCKGKEPPFISSFGQVKKEVLKEAEAFLRENPNIKVTDLGCGSGCLLTPLARKFKNSVFVGYEYDVLPYLIAKIKSLFFKNVIIYKRDFFKADLSEYKLVLCYLGNELAPKVAEKLNADLKKDALVISEVFRIPGLKQIKEIKSFLAFKDFNVFVYKPKK